MVKFSVILPVRNGGEYIKECVNSILSQTFQNFNLIILDNCSTDGTTEWLASLQHEKIIIYTSDRSLSIEENWARITTVPKNEFITLIGHDDILYPDFLKNIDKLVTAYPAAGLYHTHFHFIDANTKIIRNSRPMNQFYSFNDLLTAFLTRSVDSMGTGYVMRSKDYDAAGGIPVQYPNLLFADFSLWLTMAAHGGMAVSQEIAFAFRVHKSTTGTSQDAKLHAGLALYVEHLYSLKQKNADAAAIIDKYAAGLLLFYCKGFSHRLLRTSLQTRHNLTVDRFIGSTKKLASLLGVQEQYKPEAIISIRAAKLIDSNVVLRNFFLLFKRIFDKPFL